MKWKWKVESIQWKQENNDWESQKWKFSRSFKGKLGVSFTTTSGLYGKLMIYLSNIREPKEKEKKLENETE